MILEELVTIKRNAKTAIRLDVVKFGTLNTPQFCYYFYKIQTAHIN